jgi:hypothetical protein
VLAGFQGALTARSWAKILPAMCEPETKAICPQCFGRQSLATTLPPRKDFLPRRVETHQSAPDQDRGRPTLLGRWGLLRFRSGRFIGLNQPLTPSLRCSLVLSDHPLAGQTPFCAENLEPASLESAAPGGWLNLWRTNIFRPRGLAAAAPSSDVIQDARPRQRSQMKGIRYWLALIARPERRR